MYLGTDVLRPILYIYHLLENKPPPSKGITARAIEYKFKKREKRKKRNCVVTRRREERYRENEVRREKN